MRMLKSRVPATVLVSSSLVLAGLFAAPLAGATDAKRTDGDGCREETRRVAVWPTGPKSVQGVRFKNKKVTVCDGKVVAQDVSLKKD